MEEQTDYTWALEAMSLGVLASVLIFNGMPVVGAAVAVFGCLEED
jgi:hypothetical protein